MSNVFDYIAWRGDLTFKENRLNSVDNFIFCMLSYIDMNRIFLNYNPNVRFSLSLASDEFCSNISEKEIRLGAILPSKDIRKLFEVAGRCNRFSKVEISDFVNRIDYSEEMQFCALTFHLSESEMFIAFKGTDDTLAGWKEDFKLSYLESIPSQKCAHEYLMSVANKYHDKKIYVGGHSKGGNLAKYAATYCDDTVKERIITVYNNDGPGFLADAIDIAEFEKIEPKVKNYIPQSSLVGQMFENRGQRIIVKSNVRGIYQHDCFSWQVKGAGVVALKKISRDGEKNNKFFDNSIMKMSPDERREFVKIFCEIIDQTGAKTLMEISEAKFKSVSSVMKSFKNLDKDKKALMYMFISRLMEAK